MKISNVSFINNIANINHLNKKQNTYCTKPLGIDSFERSNATAKYQTVSFLGNKIYIVDGGIHSSHMTHFSKAVNPESEIYTYNVETNPANADIKQLKSLEEQLKQLYKDTNGNENNDYIAIPALASFPLLNLKDQIRSVTGKDLYLTPQNVKEHKNDILEFLKAIYDNPDRYREYINYLDPMKQGVEYTYGVIREINKFQSDKIYIPAGHPNDASIKWLAGQKNQKPELYNYIATGFDTDNAVKSIIQELRDRNLYEFNLLTLSNSKVVNIKDISGKKDYIFAAYDGTSTDGERGVYNLSPVRENGVIKGYSFTDTTSNEYPYDEFPLNAKVENISQFVGLNINDVLADSDEAFDFLIDPSDPKYKNKLFRIEDVFPEKEIVENKLKLRGDYVDSSLQLFFRKNKNDEIIFPQCDCEGSGKPSIHTMWGSCFSIFNAIAKDIKFNEQFEKLIITSGQQLKDYENLIYQTKDISKLNRLLSLQKKYCQEHEIAEYKSNIPVTYIKLGNAILIQYDNIIEAENLYNIAINMLAARVLNYLGEINKPLGKIKQEAIYYKETQNKIYRYNEEKLKYEKMSFIEKLLTPEPVIPDKQNEDFKDSYICYNNIRVIANTFGKLAKICERKNIPNSVQNCLKAQQSLLDVDEKTTRIIQRRANNNIFMDDIFY